MTPVFLTKAEVLAIHTDQITRYGGVLGVRDAGILDSAVAQAAAAFDENWLHADLFEMAAAYLFHLVQGHPFIDGNKRVGAVAALVFLELNDVAIEADEDELADLVLSVACGKCRKSEVAEFFRLHAAS